MTREELHQLISSVQRQQTELDNLEVKAARGGTPRRLFEPLSAFANRTGGGVILFGLNETSDFSIVGVGDAHRLQEELTNLAAHEMEPPLRPEFIVDEIDDHTVVAVTIEEIPVDRKPCFYKNAGLQKGAYIRVGNTNRQMTDYEIFGYMSSRGQPTNDEDIIHEALLEDLDDSLLNQYLDNLRRTRPKATFLQGQKEEILVRLRVIGRDGESLRPTLAGLLMFGKYPQEFLPQITITFIQYFGTTEDERTPQGARFVDNRTFEGPVPEMVAAAESYVMGAMRKASLIEGMFRRDIPEYPQEALREAIANAVAHRDYSSHVRGSYIQIRMFANRLEVSSPGGLFGNVTVDNIDEEHSTRNARLMRMMEDMHIVENRGSGIKAMLQALRAANLEPPRFDDWRSSFKITFHNHTLMSPAAITWLNQFANHALNDRQRLTLIYLRHHGKITNSDYRRLNRVDTIVAGQELRSLTQAGLIEQQGIGRGTSYTLTVPHALADEQLPQQSDEERIIAYVQEHGSISNAECRELLEIGDTRAYYLLTKLCAGSRLKPEGKGKGRRYVSV